MPSFSIGDTDFLLDGSPYRVLAGANDKGTYRSIATSYDYDAPLAEDGTPTEKFWRFREVIAKYAPDVNPKFVPPWNM